MKTWYFAYGSNLDVEQMETRTEAVHRAVRCRLPRHRLAFSKLPDSGIGAFANIIADESSSVWGVAYWCDENAIQRIDRREGVATGHYRHENVDVVTDAGDVLHAMTYVAGDDNTREGLRPRSEYLRTIIAGARQHALPREYVAALLVLEAGATD